MKTNPVGWFEIYVDDMKRAKKFYETVFATQLSLLESPELEMWAFPMEMNQAGISGTLCKMAGVKAGGNSTMVYFSSQDCSVEEARVTAAGGTVQRTKCSIGQYGFISLVSDTEGNMIGIHSRG